MKKMKFYIKQIMMFAIVGATAFSIACDALNGGDDPKTVDEPVASFQLEVDATNFLQVTFTNFSQNATSYTWDFGDGNSSTDESPVHIYAEGGSYTVVLTATNDAGSATKSEKVDLDDPLSTQRKLIGDNGKVWQFVADASTGVNAYDVFPDTRDAIWWSLGGAEQLCVRECIMDDTWTFNTDGTFTFENHGDFWAEGAFKADLLGGCFDASVAENWVGANGEDLNGWNSGTHDFTFDPIAGTLVITGGFIGIPKAANNAEVSVPQASVAYTVVKLVNSVVDTLVLETASGGVVIWRSTLVSYDNASDKIVVGECAPVEQVNVTFKVDMNGYVGAFTTVYVSGSFNGWGGESNPLSDANSDGIWEVTLPLAANTDFEYKFQMDNWAAFEQWDNADLDCVISSDGTNNNRALSTGTSDATVSYCFGTCSSCGGDVTLDAVNIDFETNSPTFEMFGGTITVAAVANPVSGGINTSATVGQVDQAAGVEGWAGIATILSGKIDFSTKTTFKMKVYSPAVGQVVKFKLEDSAAGGNNKEVDATTTVANAWEELTFTFDAADSGKWDKMALFFDFQGAAKGSASLYYFDDVVF